MCRPDLLSHTARARASGAAAFILSGLTTTLCHSRYMYGNKGNKHQPGAHLGGPMGFAHTVSRTRGPNHGPTYRRSHGVRSHTHGFPGPAESNQAGPPMSGPPMCGVKSNLPVPRFLLEAPEAPFSRDCLVEPLALHPGFRDLSVCAASDDLHLDHAPVACECCSHLVEE